MEVKVKFNDINVKEEKEKTLVKVLMLKGEKGDSVSAEWGTITGNINNQTDLKNALDSKANQAETTQALNQKANASDLNNYYNKSQMDTALGSKIGTEDIVDTLDSTSYDKVLAASQGKILNDKLVKKVYYSDTVALMKSSTNLVEGDMVITKGYYAANDDGAGKYEIVSTESQTNYQEELNNGLYATLIIENSLNSKQLGISDTLNDNSAKIQYLFDISEKIPVDFIGGSYKITNPLYFSLTMCINILGHVEIQDYIEQEGSTLRCKTPVYNSTGYIKPVFNNVNGIIRLINYKENVLKNGMEIGSTNYTSSGIIKGLNIRKYDNAMLLKPKNMYGIKFEDCVFAFSKVGIKMDSNVNNSGEAVNFINCSFIRNQCGIDCGAEWVTKYDECIFDNNLIAIYSSTPNVQFFINKSHFEGINEYGVTQETSYNGKNGLCCVGDSTKAYQSSCIVLNECSIYALDITNYPTYLFDGSSLDVILNNNVIWYSSTFNNVINDNGDLSGFTKMFACSDKVRSCQINNNIFRYDSIAPEFRLKKDNQINAHFEGVDTSQSEITLWNVENLDCGDYEIELLPSTEKGTKVVFETINDMICLKVTPKQDYTMATFNLKYKNYIPLKGNKFDCFSYMKGMKNASNTYTTVNIELYDKDLTLLDTIVNVGTNYGGTTHYDQWFTTSYLNGNRASNNDYRYNNIPSNAVYYKPVFNINALRGHFADRVEDEETITATSPVYVTGLYCYNY